MINKTFSLLTIVLIILITSRALCFADDIYISQTTQVGDTGTDCVSSHSVTWFNTAVNWANPKQSGKIGPGDTVHLCGTISTQLNLQNSGSSGAPITILFEQNAKLSQPVGTLMNAQNKSYIIVDGGTNGIMENTDNGTTLTYQQAVSGIYASGASNLEIKNITMQNLYVHTSVADNLVDFASNGALYMNGSKGNISIHDNTFHDICWIINIAAWTPGTNGLQVYNNYFYNYDHAVVPNGSTTGLTNVNIYNNHFGATANWDTTSNKYHHDGIHVFYGASSAISELNIYNNLFDGDWGDNNTAHIFLEGTGAGTPQPRNMSNVTIYNNVFLVYPGRKMNNGTFSCGGSSCAAYNNTVVGGKYAGSDVCANIGYASNTTTFKNNVITSCNQLIGMNGSTTNSYIDNNIYADGGNNAFVWCPEPTSTCTFTNSFATWKSLLGADGNSQKLPSAGLDNTGHPQTNSAVIRAGANLTSIGITALDSDKAGNTRPSSGAWDAGAYQIKRPMPPILKLPN